MDIGRSFTYITQDQDWVKKVLLGGVIMLIPVVGPFFALGYMLETMKNVIAGREIPLPEIGDFGGKLVEGLKAWVISFVYALPLILFAICAQAGNLAPILAENVDPDTVEVLATVSIGVSVCCGCLLLLYSILISVYLVLVLRSLTDFLVELYLQQPVIYGVIALLLIVAQAWLLEMVTSFLLERLGLE